MRHLVRLDEWSTDDLSAVFRRADDYRRNGGPKYAGCAVLFFPDSSLRTRVSFERGMSLMGLQPVTFPPETLDKPEARVDVAHYLASWADVLIVRHPDIAVLDELAAANALPVVNAMTNENHPCEVLSDLYTLSQDGDPRRLRYLFVGADGNIARAWQEAARAFGLNLVQSCPAPLATPGARWNGDLLEAASRTDVILTDGPGEHTEALAPYRITTEVLAAAPAGVRLAPCPPFLRGREVSADAVSGPAFVGYGFKRFLLPLQQAVVSYALDA